MARDTAVFISYARSDGESYAQELRERLKGEPGIDLWQDRIRMEAGDFEQQIKQAIDSARYLVVIMTPGALRSGWVEKEWRYARENGVCICPIKPKFQSQSTESELSVLHAALPRWMQQIQIFDFEEYWNRFVAVLRSPCAATRTPFLAPALPANLVQRPLEYKRIVDGVLDSERKNPSGKKVVLYGSGGFGKTTMALSLCHEEDVFAACDGGILWTTLGAEPSPVSELTKIYAALTGERPTFATLDDAMFAVEQKMEGKRCLFIIDDVWEAGHLKPFLQAGGQCTKLITTRRFEIAVQEAEASCRINVAELTPDEAVELLSARLDPPLETQIRFRRLAERLGEWPLLLQLANRTLHIQTALYDEQTPLREKIDGALDWAKAEYDARGVIAFDREDAKAREDAIAKTVELSLGLLKENRARCLELGIFPEDTDVPLELLGVLWQTDAGTTNRLAQRMHDLALIKLDRSRKPGASASSGSIRLHDAMRSYFLSQLSEPWLLDAKLADTWTDPKRIGGDYALQHVAYHLAEAMADPSQIVKRGQQLLELLTNPRYREYQERHGDPAALNRQIELALERASAAVGPDLAALVAALAVLHQSYAEAERDPQAIFEAAAAGRVREAVERLELFDAEPEWNTLTRLLVAGIAASANPAEAKSLADEAAGSCNRPELSDLLGWVQMAPGAIPAYAPPRFAQIQGYFSGIPDLYSYVAAILQRAGGAQTPQGFEPIDYSLHASGITRDASAFIAEQDGPVLVVFAQSDPFSNTRYLEEYIDVHAANRYRYYRNRSLWALLKFVLVYPDGMWVRDIVRRIVAAALTVTHVDYEEFLPLAVLGLRARFGDQSAADELERLKYRLFTEAPTLGPAATAGPSGSAPNDSWAHYQRRACALAEVYALALDRPADATALLHLARQMPKGFAGFRAFSALTAAESAELASPGDRQAVEAALESARAASHRIQDYPFCLRTTAMVNAMRSRWWSRAIDLEPTLDRFCEDPLGEDFCAIHRVDEGFSFRNSDALFQSLPIPPEVLEARTLREIAGAYWRDPETLVRVNPGLDLDRKLSRQNNDEVNIPEPDFVPLLAARFAASALSHPGLTDEQRSSLIQRLVPLAMANRTTLDTVLARLLLSARNTAHQIPDLLRSLELPSVSEVANASERLVS